MMPPSNNNNNINNNNNHHHRRLSAVGFGGLLKSTGTKNMNRNLLLIKSFHESKMAITNLLEKPSKLYIYYFDYLRPFFN